MVNAGLSLGEYAALGRISGLMTPEDAFRVVAKRGEYMQEAVPTGGAMTAVLWRRHTQLSKKSARRRKESYLLQITTVRDRL